MGEKTPFQDETGVEGCKLYSGRGAERAVKVEEKLCPCCGDTIRQLRQKNLPQRAGF
jgi:hypothetical protein